MKYRGLDPRTRRLRWGLFLAAVMVTIATTAGGAVDALVAATGPERESLPWLATRAFAMLSWLALSLSVIYGLLLSTGILDALAHRTVSFTLHQDLGSVGLALGMVHAAVLTIDRSVPYSPLEVLVPFAGPYRPLWVGLGQVGLYLSAVVVASFYGRKRLGQKSWRRLHHVTFVAFAATTAHGLMAGTDTGATWAYAGYVVVSATVGFLLAYRIVMSIAGRLLPKARPSAGPGSPIPSSSARPTLATRAAAGAQPKLEVVDPAA